MAEGVAAVVVAAVVAAAVAVGAVGAVGEVHPGPQGTSSSTATTVGTLRVRAFGGNFYSLLMPTFHSFSVIKRGRAVRRRP